MRAAFFEAYRTIRVREVPVPEPQPGDVLLRIVYCGICGSDLSLYKTGVLSGPNEVLGHEICAVVEHDTTGRWAQGARVVPFPARGCGECLWCREGKPKYCYNPPSAWGGFAEHMAHPVENLLPVPDDLDDRRAAITEPLGVAVRGVGLADARPGDLAYVAGLGPIGLFTVAALVAAGCRVVGGDPIEERRQLAIGQGCEAAFDPTAQDPMATMLAHDPHGPRMAFECSGVPDSLQQVFDACGHLGTVGILGIPMAPVLLLRMTIKEQRAFSISGPSMESMRGAMELLRQRPQIADVVTGTVPLDETDAAFSRLVDGSLGAKVLIAPAG